MSKCWPGVPVHRCVPCTRQRPERGERLRCRGDAGADLRARNAGFAGGPARSGRPRCARGL